MRYPWALPGAKVVCVDSDPASVPPPPGLKWHGGVRVVEGETYTISSVQTHKSTGLLCILLVELPKRDTLDVGYFVGRFRPLHTQESDVALFAHLLTPAPTSPMLPTKELTDQ